VSGPLGYNGLYADLEGLIDSLNYGIGTMNQMAELYFQATNMYNIYIIPLSVPVSIPSNLPAEL
jgi:hypothetical protein